MNLPSTLLHALRKLNYKQPTPIQRKAIPPLLRGLDVVAMARTGSGKTAAFGIPIVCRLKEHCSIVGVRAIVVSPTRELAVQTGRALTGLAKGTDLRVAQIVGGESLEGQFAVLAGNPDILVVTPGRLLHLTSVETRLSLGRVEVVVFDEADRLFEMGFREQLKELLGKLPERRQTALFSATLPSMVAEFAEAGLRTDAVLIRLDAELKLSPDLTCSFFSIRSEYRIPALLEILNRIYNASTTGDKLTIVFTATRHHVEYIVELLAASQYRVTGVYGAMDQEARTESLMSFRNGTKPIMVVTDLAARGLDIPHLDNVINVDMPPTGKMFIHRVGRAARAGRTGHAYTLCTNDELPYYVDLAKFVNLDMNKSIVRMEQGRLDLLLSQCQGLHRMNGTLESCHAVMLNACKQYHASRPPATPDSYAVAKSLLIGPEPGCDGAQGDMLSAIRQYKRAGTRERLSQSQSQSQSTTLSTKTTPTTSNRSDHYLSYTPSNARFSDDQHYSLRSQLHRAADHHHPTTDASADTVSSRPGNLLRQGKKYRDDGKYDQWKRKHHVSLPAVGESELDERTRSAICSVKKRWRTSKTSKGGKGGGKVSGKRGSK
jgi:ATP-dependent RNA helicase DDX54/DBP10